MTAKLTGKKEIAKKLKKLSQKAGASIARRSVSAGARVIRDEAKSLAPVDSGTLKKAIKVKTRKFRNKQGFHAYVFVDSGGRARYNAWYARFVEFGVQPHQIKPKNKEALTLGDAIKETIDHPGHGAKPFMRPAFDTKSDEAVKVTGKTLWKLLDKEAAK